MPSPDGDAALIEAVGLRRSFGRVRVLHDIGLRLCRGEALAIVGPNGAGKSTLLRLLAGIMRPDAGQVRVKGKTLEESGPETRRSIGLLLHQSLLYDDLTLLENLTFTARLYGLPRPRQTARAALEEAGLGSRAGDLPRKLSRGLLQRAALVRSTLHQPEILLLDEPFTGLDAASAERLRSDLFRRRSSRHGLVIVTHHLAEIWPVATRVAVLVDGRWATDETRDASLETFLLRYQGLIGA